MQYNEDLEKLRQAHPKYYEVALQLAIEPTITAALDAAGMSNGWYYALDASIRDRIEAAGASLRVRPVELALSRLEGEASLLVDNYLAFLKDERRHGLRYQATKDVADRINMRRPAEVDVMITSPAETFAGMVDEIYSDDQDDDAGAGDVAQHATQDGE